MNMVSPIFATKVRELLGIKAIPLRMIVSTVFRVDLTFYFINNSEF